MATPWAYSTSEDTPRFHEKGNGGVRSRGFSFLPKSVTAFKKPTSETRANLRKETDMEIWQGAQPRADQMPPAPNGRWPVPIPSGLDRCVEFCVRLQLQQFPNGTWGASIEFETVQFSTQGNQSADQALAALRSEVAGCPHFERLARPGPTRQSQARVGKRVRPVTFVSPPPRCTSAVSEIRSACATSPAPSWLPNGHSPLPHPATS
jgi:hypothetical protein